MNLHDVSKVILPDHADLNILLIDDAPRLVVVQSNELTRSTVMEVDAVGLLYLFCVHCAEAPKQNPPKYPAGSKKAKKVPSCCRFFHDLLASNQVMRVAANLDIFLKSL